jgi:predicted acyltransferase
LFWWIADVKGWRRGLGLWTAIGSNSILAYVIAALFMGAFWEVTTTLFGGLKPHLGQFAYGLFGTVVTYAQAWLLLVYLRRQRIFLRL